MITSDVKLGKNVRIYHKELINLFGCSIDDDSSIGSFVEIGKGVKIGKKVKIQAFAYIPEGVTIEDEVFIGPHTCFTNDKLPRALNKDWKIIETKVCKGASVGANATIVCGVTIGEESIVGAGSVVTKDVPPKVIVAGNPAKVIRKIEKR